MSRSRLRVALTLACLVLAACDRTNAPTAPTTLPPVVPLEVSPIAPRAVNGAPLAVADAYATTKGVLLVIGAPGLLANDFDPDGDTFIVTSLAALPTHGQITRAVTNGAFTYVPDAGFAGTDGFRYLLRDSRGAVSAESTVTIEVLAPPDVTPPVIVTVAGPIVLFPSDNRYDTFHVSDLVSAVSDAGSPSLVPGDVVITRVTSDERQGPGVPGADIVIGSTCKSVDLRAERNGNRKGRVYIIDLAIADAAGNVGTASVRVSVPKRPRLAAIEDAAAETVQGDCTP